jgi:hypothetical protein
LESHCARADLRSCELWRTTAISAKKWTTYRTVYGQVSDAQHYFLGQTALFLKSLSLLLPFWNSDVTAIDPFVGDSTYRGS